MSLEITGTPILIKDVQNITETFSKREVIVEIQDGNYTQEIQIEFHNDRTDLIDSYEIGDLLKFHINLRGKRFDKIGEETRWFTSIVCWKLEKA